ncbi:unnamed protein product [Parascedosporium putredinis]|uniref:Uncharacterized protein n=1 Tax=Parascedosporium putredinis TaxID=1442378 RepID=A0A9P1H3G0_9PEZI|nr:unnamed protein product [Parascedosporium putredinis]CAI7995126.1 unnamed protein product [Parascedosporium putredinis]
MRRLLSKKPRDLLPGEVRFFSFYQPSLQGGIHTVEVWQDVTVPDEEKPGKIDADTQEFNVIAPRYNLPAGAVDSVYPPPGESAPVTVLPHIVLKDAHMPWNRDPTFVEHEVQDKDPRNLAPWLLLLVFTPDELRLEPSDLGDVLTRLPEVERKQSETMAVRMRARETPFLNGVVNAIPFDETNDAHDAEGPVDVSDALDVSQYKYLAHVRQVAVDGMAVAGKPDAGNGDDKESELFSIVISPRTGPIGLKVPTTTVVHLVSLNTKKSLPLSSDSDRVAMVSLHSWTYNCLPAEDAPDEEEQKDPSTSADDPAPDPLDNIISQRQKDGYTLVRHRTITGETTAAIIRGPFSPKSVPHPLRQEKDFAIQSNFGTDLQILDPNLSLMDITYSSAWQLGKTLGMGDQAFSASLARLRGAIHAAALGRSKVDVHSALGTYQSRGNAVSGMRDLVKGLNALNQALSGEAGQSMAVGANRWDYSHPAASASGNSNSTSHHVGISMRSPHISTRIAAHADDAAFSLAEASDGSLYNEHQVANNPDFAHVYAWVLDKLHLANVPAHYLLPDPSYLPQETLRFFYVDENWTEALVDGALSLANHWGATPQEDFCRTAIKAVINKRLTTPDPTLGGWHIQMPKYGLLVRSQLLVQFPDITVSVEFAAARTTSNTATGEPEPPKAPILRFTIGSQISDDALTVSYKKIYTEPDPDKRHDKANKKPIYSKTFPMRDKEVFDLQSRTLKVEPYLDKVHEALWTTLDRADFSDEAKTSALLALQLNESIPELRIAIPSRLTKSLPTTSGPATTFQFTLPTTTNNTTPPPPLDPLPRHGLTTARTAVIRPRAPSPRREALLVAERARMLKGHPTRVPHQPNLLHPDGSDDPNTAADLPKWELAVYTVRNRLFVPSTSLLPVDLIVKIVRSPTSLVPDRPLLWIEYYASKAAEDGKPKTRGTVNVKVVPRSSKGVTIDRIPEASFLLSRAKIAWYKSTEPRSAEVKIRFAYAKPESDRDKSPTIISQSVYVELREEIIPKPRPT